MIGLILDSILLALIYICARKKKKVIVVILTCMLSSSVMMGYIISSNPQSFYQPNVVDYIETELEDDIRIDSEVLKFKNGLEVDTKDKYTLYSMDTQYYSTKTIAYVNKVEYILEKKYFKYIAPVKHMNKGYTIELLINKENKSE